MSNIGLLFNYEWCSGCQSCEIACRNEHDWPLGTWGIKVEDLGPMEMEGGVMEFDHVPIPTSFCDLCEDRVAAGGVPSCALHCLSNIIEWGPVEELAKRLPELGPKTTIFLPKNNL